MTPDDYIAKIFGMAVVVAPLVTIFTQLVKSVIPPKILPVRLYPAVALLIGVVISIFIGSRIGIEIYDSAAIGFLATVISVFGFKYGKWEETKTRVEG